MALTSTDLQQYHEQGYALHGPILPPDVFSSLGGHIDQVIAGLPEGRRPEHLDRIHFEDPFFLEVCRHPAVLDVVEQLVGPDIVLFSSHVISKSKGDGLPVPWHQDAHYWPLEPMEVTTLWLAVDPSTVENGCMRVIPGSHRRGDLQHGRSEMAGRAVLDRG